MNKKITKRLIFLGIPLLLVAGLIAGFIFYNGNNQPLSQDEISELRGNYPICGIDTPTNVTMGTPSSMEEIKKRTDTFVYGRVVGEMSTYSQSISTGDPQLDDKRKNNGINDVVDFYEYTISVIEDTSGFYNKGDEITIAANKIFIDYNPHLEDGMKIVVPVVQDNLKTDRTQFGVYGMYYVTEDDYAISAFQEESVMTRSMSGIKVQDLLSELKK